ncbi:DUF3951 domain-containing protein [Bacillus sp. JCM 19034]|uniref:DUF3951 domain-containing protein n=1 Tax=Bacillus sp. JCM 19034 TaxID=1481928 RepID=UPI000785296D|nr:DUF3951 domain-containing protein [Bacillus sp. JCM 19034]
MIVTTIFYMTFIIFLLYVISHISYKMIKNKSLPDNNYTPFDYITSQSPVELHEEKEVREEDEEEGEGEKRR